MARTIHSPFVSKLFPPAAFVASTLFSAAPVQAQAEVIDVHEELDFDIDEIVVNPCNGELVHVTGTAQAHNHLVLNNNAHDSFHLEQHVNTQGLSGAGSADNTYTASEALQMSSNFAVGEEETMIDDVHLIGRGAAPNFVMHVLRHITVNANGTVTSFIDNFTSECR